MIIYNVGRAWFTMKSDAEAYRKSNRVGPPSATIALRIDDRDQLAGLLNGLTGIVGPEVAAESSGAPPEVIQRNAIAAPDYVPRFLVDSWDRLFGKQKG